MAARACTLNGEGVLGEKAAAAQHVAEELSIMSKKQWWEACEGLIWKCVSDHDPYISEWIW